LIKIRRDFRFGTPLGEPPSGVWQKSRLDLRTEIKTGLRQQGPILTVREDRRPHQKGGERGGDLFFVPRKAPSLRTTNPFGKKKGKGRPRKKKM